MSEICKSCKEPEYDPEEQVCKSCGIVCEDTKFGVEVTGHSSYLPSTSSKFMKKKTRLASGLQFGMENLDTLCRMYRTASIFKEEASLLLKKVHSIKSFHIKQDVGIMAGCCLIHVLRRNNHDIPINDLCRKLNCSKKSVSKFLKVVKAIEPSQPPYAGKEISQKNDGCDFHLKSLESAINFTVEAIPDQDKGPLMEKTTELVKLAFSLWLGTGRSMEGLVVASTFLCWKSMHPSRKNVTLLKFCQDFSLDARKARNKISELNEMLLKLGQKIPSLTENYVNEKNVLFHLDYILKNSTTLRNDINSEDFDAEEISKKEFAMFRKPPVRTARHETIETVTYDSTMCASDIEISDAEINSYIRPKEQVKVMEALRELKTARKEPME